MHKFKRPHSAPTLSLGVPRFNLNVLICEPEFGQHHHWALQLENLSTGDDTIFEVQGADPSAEIITYQCRPQYYALKIIKSVHIKDFQLSPASYGALTHAMEHGIQCKSDKPPWKSKGFVTDVLDMLEEEWWIDADDDDYVRARRHLKALEGPISSIHPSLLARSKPTDPSEGSSGSGQQVNAEPKKFQFIGVCRIIGCRMTLPKACSFTYFQPLSE